jgi:Ca2+/H+ antiporter, TMEM165/GDT1 family
VSGLAAALGRTLLTKMRLSTLRRIGGGVCLVLAAYTALEIVGVL